MHTNITLGDIGRVVQTAPTQDYNSVHNLTQSAMNMPLEQAYQRISYNPVVLRRDVVIYRPYQDMLPYDWDIQHESFIRRLLISQDRHNAYTVGLSEKQIGHMPNVRSFDPMMITGPSGFAFYNALVTLNVIYEENIGRLPAHERANTIEFGQCVLDQLRVMKLVERDPSAPAMTQDQQNKRLRNYNLLAGQVVFLVVHGFFPRAHLINYLSPEINHGQFRIGTEDQKNSTINRRIRDVANAAAITEIDASLQYEIIGRTVGGIALPAIEAIGAREVSLEEITLFRASRTAPLDASGRVTADDVRENQRMANRILAHLHSA